ncbi:MAG: TerB family tellurite resistance protein [Deltaproteobacteria bacterium]|nr:MAG: TerB family tellurite resistance protein [Deltaproteobacteria bacterium]
MRAYSPRRISVRTAAAGAPVDRERAMPAIAFKLEELPLVAGILLDAALADGEVDGTEVDAIRSVLCEAAGLSRLPQGVLEALRGFDPDGFDLEGTCEELGLDTRHRKRELLALVGSVVAADGVIDAGEDVWLSRLARIMGRSEQQMDRFHEELLEAVAEMHH